MQENVIKAKKSSLFRLARLLFAGFFLWLIIRSFFFQVMYIPSSSMRGTLNEGDYIVVNKLAYGPRMPITLLSLPFAGSDAHLDWIEFSYHRAPGYSDVKRGDVIVFNLPGGELPIDLRRPYIKRCVALPGDSLSIVKGEIFINGKKTPQPEWGQQRYRVELKNCEDPPALFERFNIKSSIVSADRIHYTLLLSDYQLNQLRASGKISTFSLDPVKAGTFNVQLFPHDPNFKWNVDFYGPLQIPAKGKTVELTTKNISLYRNCIVDYEYNTLELKRDSLFLNGQYSTTYTFRQDYFFVMGDNRYDSEDSRYWGFVPESHVIGKASLLLTTSGPADNFSLIR
ncbi:MAG: signal peptidase I [Bacteroidota bacterium]|nr:signal peptidase I [Bacteroidota bacterium]